MSERALYYLTSGSCVSFFGRFGLAAGDFAAASKAAGANASAPLAVACLLSLR
jgi:hypothetical protein